jgi:hypothetical protein
MPQAIPGIVAAAKAVAWKAVIKKIAVSIAINLVLSKVSKALAPKQARARQQPLDVEYSGTLEGRRIIYGQNKISGLQVLPPLVTGGNGEYLHQVLALAGTEINAIGDVYFDTTAITSAQIDGSGNVTGGTYVGKASIRKYLGTSSQTVDPVLNADIAAWGTTRRGRGIAYLALRYQFEPKVYANGKPEVSALVQGRKVYDPRLDTSPGANPTNASYIAYSSNPALCLADYLTLSIGVGESATRIDWPLVVAAANICDENVLIPPASPTTTQDRYTCNIVIDATTEYEANIESLARAMMGVCYYSGGKWRMYAGAWSASAFALTESDVIGEVSIQTAASRKSGFYNAVRGHFIDPARNYQPSEFQPRTDAAYDSEDGERIYLETDFPACQNEYEAQRNAILLRRASRNQITVNVVCALSMFKVRPYETGTATIAEVGWVNRAVRCVGWKFRSDPAVELTLQEVASSDFNDPAVSDYTVPGVPSSPGTPVGFAPGQPSNFTAVPQVDGILFTWTPPANTVVGVLYELFEHTSASPFSSSTLVYSGADSQYLLQKANTTTRYYWVRASYPGSNQTGDELPGGNGMPAAAASVTTGFRATASPTTASGITDAATITSQSTTASPINGTAPYTYSWAWVSGGTGLSIGSASAATTSFSGNSFALDEVREGVARCTITDNASATATVDVAVYLLRQSFF